VICTTDGIKADFENRYPDIPKKYVTITNGFDPADFPAEISMGTMGNSARSQVLRIVHAGTFGGERSPREFLLALGQLLRERPELKDLIEVVFVGQNSKFTDGRTIEEFIDEYGCGSVAKLTGFVSRKASLDYMMQADVLLLIIGRVPREGALVYGISGKLYDYGAARKPVLTVSEPGSTSQLAQALNLGPVVHPDDTEKIKSILVSLWGAHSSGAIPYNPNLELLKSFEFSSLTARFATCLDQTCKGGNQEHSENRSARQ
jgi:glycosyltransferase involved in cell wall biosynthesis